MKKFKSKLLIFFCTFIVLICSILTFTACEDDTPIENGLSFSFSLNTGTFEAYSENKDIIDVDIPSYYKDIPVTAIRMTGFLNCSLLENVKIPDSVIKIYLCSFEGCSSLKKVNLPDSLIAIGESAFNCCTSLQSIIIPADVTTIGTNAFYGCTSLTIYCEAEGAPDGWSDGWNGSCPVIWNYNEEI